MTYTVSSGTLNLTQPTNSILNDALPLEPRNGHDDDDDDEIAHLIVRWKN